MLVLTRSVGEELVIGSEIHVRVVSVKRNRVRLGIVAPAAVRVDRLEVNLKLHALDGSHPESITAEPSLHGNLASTPSS
ncbi:MAG: carbon storage regulator [Planctomycetales bacterium]|nr:carbon storage regulator [Planctomycetales bacterium]